MGAMDAILGRHSIRKYTAQPVPEDVIEQLLRAGMAAPSAVNEQAWQFVVITERALLDPIATICPHAQAVREAPLTILVCIDTELEKFKGLGVMDCSAATENILIAANALGLGGVWQGVLTNEERITGLRKLLGLPVHLLPLALVSVGYPAETKPCTERYDVARVHRDRW